MSGLSPFFPLLRPNVLVQPKNICSLVQRSIKFFEMRLHNMWMSPNRELKTELFLGNVKKNENSKNSLFGHFCLIFNQNSLDSSRGTETGFAKKGENIMKTYGICKMLLIQF